MTYEEMERSMEFMRQHLVNLEQLQEESEHKELEKRLADSNESLTESQKKTDERIRTFLSALERRFGGNGRAPEST
jgi:hypothetical protein